MWMCVCNWCDRSVKQDILLCSPVGLFACLCATGPCCSAVRQRDLSSLQASCHKVLDQGGSSTTGTRQLYQTWARVMNVSCRLANGRPWRNTQAPVKDITPHHWTYVNFFMYSMDKQHSSEKRKEASQSGPPISLGSGPGRRTGSVVWHCVLSDSYPLLAKHVSSNQQQNKGHTAARWADWALLRRLSVEKGSQGVKTPIPRAEQSTRDLNDGWFSEWLFVSPSTSVCPDRVCQPNSGWFPSTHHESLLNQGTQSRSFSKSCHLTYWLTDWVRGCVPSQGNLKPGTSNVVNQTYRWTTIIKQEAMFRPLFSVASCFATFILCSTAVQDIHRTYTYTIHTHTVHILYNCCT